MRWSDCQASDVRWAVCPNAKRFRGFRPPSGSALGGPGSAHRAGWFRGEFDMPLPGAAKTIQPGFAQGAADWRSGPRRSILSVLYPVHPFPLRGTSPQGETRDMREKTGSAMLHVSPRWFPLWWLAPPPCPVGSMSLDSRVAGLPYESSSFATPAVRLVNQKEGPFMGRLRAYFDQLAHPMQDVHSGTITRAYCRAIYEERPRGVLFFPLNRGKSGAAGKGGRRAQRANQQNAFHAI